MTSYIEDEQTLTQFGSKELSFRNEPRTDEGETDISLLAGSFTADEAIGLLTRWRRGAWGEEGVRYTTAGALRRAGFHVKPTPTPRNPHHVSVVLDREWVDDDCVRFNACFDEPVWKEGDT